MFTEARPVRIDAISCCKSERAFSIFDFKCASTSFTELKLGVTGAVDCSAFIGGCLRKSGSCRRFRLPTLRIITRGDGQPIRNVELAGGGRKPADILEASVRTLHPTCAW